MRKLMHLTKTCCGRLGTWRNVSSSTMGKGGFNPTTIAYCSLEDNRCKEVEDLMVERFVRDENTFRLCRNCEGGQPEDHRPWIRKAIPLHDRTQSLLAIETVTDRVAGFVLSDVATVDCHGQALNPLAEAGTEAGRLVDGFFKQLEGDYDVFRILEVEKVLCWNIIVVDHRYRKFGIALDLSRQSLELARDSGCDAVVACATSPFSRRVAEKLGFRQERFLPFTSSLLANVRNVDLSACGPEDGVSLVVCRF